MDVRTGGESHMLRLTEQLSNPKIKVREKKEKISDLIPDHTFSFSMRVK